MTPATTSCPFCNCVIDPSRVDFERPHCPRCDNRLPSILAESLRGSTAASMPEFAPPGKRATLRWVMLTMLFMACVAGAFIWSTVEFRRKNDLKKGRVFVGPIAKAPGELGVLGSTPAQCNILAGANLEDLRANPTLKKALFESPPPWLEWLRIKLLETTGLALDDVEEVGVGIVMTNELPKIFVVLQVARPYDPDAVVRLYEPAKPAKMRDRPVVRFPLRQVGEGLVWCMDERRIVMAFRVEPGTLDFLDGVPAKSRPKLEGSAELVRTLVREKLPRQSPLWLAADMSTPTGLHDFLAVVGARGEGLEEILNIKAGSLGLTADGDLTLRGDALCGTAKEASALEKRLLSLDWRDAKSLKVVGPEPGAKEPWVSLQVRYDIDGLRRVLARGPGFAGKK